MYLRLLILVFAVSLCAGTALAQAPVVPPPAQPSAAPQPVLDLFRRAASWRWEQVSRDHVRYTGQAEIEGEGTKFFADQIDVYTDTNRLEATGNVVFAGPDGRISAERVEFDVRNGTGIFYQASGSMSLGPATDRAPFGGQDPDVLFYGERIEKMASRKYRITRGAFTTCVQPTPRWEVASGSVTLNLNEYAVARNMVLRVKGVPVMYLPVIYYPIQDDERATGFLLPTYGTSTLRGQAISNAFFWAIDRSQDATFFHDWFTRAGQGVGGEYRYVAAPQSYGNFRMYRFGRNEQELTQSGTTTVLPAATSFELTGNAVHTFGTATRARLRLDYFSDLLTQQLYQQNVYQATRTTRVIDGGLSSTLGPVALSGQYQRSESFSTATRSTVYGGTPRINSSLAPLRIGPAYMSLTSDYAYMPYREIEDGVVLRDRSLSRADVSPTVRVPLSRLTYLAVNSSATYRSTYYSKSLDDAQAIVPEAYLRQYLSLRSDVVGPVLTRIWDTPDSGFAERMKHVIEPAFSVDHATNIDQVQKTPLQTDVSDFVVSGATRFTYGLNNRLFYRGRTVDGVRGQTREFVTFTLQQTYYTNPQSSQYDTTAYGSATTARRPRPLSPVAMAVRVTPTLGFDVTTRVEYDVYGNGLLLLTSGGGVNGTRGSASLNYSHRRLTSTSKPDDYVSANSSTRLLEGRVTANYGLSWNIAQSYIVSQTASLSYFAQCCGVQAEFQQLNFPAGYRLPNDRRFNFAFVLAGLGTFSNFFGAFGGGR
jgi:LPS-assembly protein